MSSMSLGKPPSLLSRSNVDSFSRASASRKVTEMRRIWGSSSCDAWSVVGSSRDETMCAPATSSGRAVVERRRNDQTKDWKYIVGMHNVRNGHHWLCISLFFVRLDFGLPGYRKRTMVFF